jgi:hypothetical protein
MRPKLARQLSEPLERKEIVVNTVVVVNSSDQISFEVAAR